MPTALNQRFSEKLQQRMLHGTRRSLPYIGSTENRRGVDFASNDYLGFARNKDLQKRCLAAGAQAVEEADCESILGSTGSRLLSGNSARVEQLEEQLARHYRAESALLFGSGYTLNCGILAALAQAGDALLLDEHVHASLKNGAKLAQAACYYFRHNDCNHLRSKLQRLRTKLGGTGQIFVVVESLYSMDGDIAPLREMLACVEEFSAHLLVDEAHGIGTIGSRGEGLVAQLGVEERILGRIHPFGKALGVSGAVLLGSQLLKDYCINFCHSFIYSTALPGFQLIAIAEAHRLLQEAKPEISRLHHAIGLMNRGLGLTEHCSPIYSIRFSDLRLVREAEHQIRQAGMQIFSIVSPTVKRGEERLRVNVHSFNSEDEIAKLLALLKGMER